MDPKTFSHRAGRTARAGRKGKGIVLLGRGREEEYVDFLAARRIPLAPQSYITAELEERGNYSKGELDEAAIELLRTIRTRLLSDRDLSDRGAKAFVSALRAYTKHEASFIFRLADVDFNDWAIAYGLLRLPAMPEIKDWRKRVAARKASEEKKREAGDDVEAVLETWWEDQSVDVSLSAGFDIRSCG